MPAALHRAVQRLHARLQTLRRAAWRRYRAVPGLLRWPLTALAAVILIVIVTNLLFGSLQQVATRELVVPAGESRTMSLQIAPGRNVAVRWQPTDPARDDADLVKLLGTLTGPGFERTTPAPLEAGGFDFKAGFAAGRYTLRLENPGARDSLPVEIRWRVR